MVIGIGIVIVIVIETALSQTRSKPPIHKDRRLVLEGAPLPMVEALRGSYVKEGLWYKQTHTSQGSVACTISELPSWPFPDMASINTVTGHNTVLLQVHQGLQ